jgi:soluble lytic murein transglycosylase
MGPLKSRRWIYALAALAAIATVASILLTYLVHPHCSEKECIPYVARYSKSYGIDADIVLAVIKTESSFNPYARGSAGERGLMQVMPGVARQIADELGIEDFRPDDLFGRDTAVRFGTYWLSRMQAYKKTDNPWVFRLAEYNAGHPNVRKWRAAADNPDNAESFLAAITIASTRRYVRDVLAAREEYKRRGIFDMPNGK